MLTAADLFSGCGGASEGLERAGFEVILAVDSDPDACESYRLNHPRTHVVCADVLNIPRYPYADLLWASPPCQKYSRARAKKAQRFADELLKFSLQVIQEIKPRWWVIENVGPVYDFPEVRPFRRALIDAADFGVPQHRVRTFITNIEIPMLRYGHVSAGEALEKIKAPYGVYPHVGFDWEIKNYRTWGPARAKIDLDRPAPTVVDQRHGGMLIHKSFLQRNGPLEVPLSSPSPTITTGPGHLEIQYESIDARQITLLEAMVLQTFPQDYQLAGSLSSQFMQIGNSVPPLLAERIVKAIAT